MIKVPRHNESAQVKLDAAVQIAKDYTYGEICTEIDQIFAAGFAACREYAFFGPELESILHQNVATIRILHLALAIKDL